MEVSPSTRISMWTLGQSLRDHLLPMKSVTLEATALLTSGSKINRTEFLLLVIYIFFYIFVSFLDFKSCTNEYSMIHYELMTNRNRNRKRRKK